MNEWNKELSEARNRFLNLYFELQITWNSRKIKEAMEFYYVSFLSCSICYSYENDANKFTTNEQRIESPGLWVKSPQSVLH